LGASGAGRRDLVDAVRCGRHVGELGAIDMRHVLSLRVVAGSVQRVLVAPKAGLLHAQWVDRAVLDQAGAS
jgi:hypothetical protein